jgi:AcrR family transcriptional regulator
MAPRVTTLTIGRAGRDVIRHHGVSAVTMRSVADELGVTPMALYRCIDTADDLRREAVNFTLDSVPAPPSSGRVPERLEAWAQEARRVVRRYPGVEGVALTDWPAMSHGCRIMELLLTVAAEHTSDGAEQVAIANAVFVYVFTRIIAERAVTARGRRRTLPALELEPRRYPRLQQHQARFATIDIDTHFRVGLRALLDGLLRGTRP